jgi:hypothetical protein
MNKTISSIALGAIAVLLIAILAVLLTIVLRGVQIEHTGYVTLAGMSEGVELRMADPVTLRVPETVHMVATGADGDAIPVDLSFATCPACGGAMIPVRLNLWTGKIDWVCPACGETTTAPPED